MSLSKARAVAIPLTPFSAALFSIKNTTALLFDHMYGTKERSQATIAVALLMSVLGMMLQSTTTQLATVCPL